MDKISRILPSSPRISSADTKDAQPVRPGVPTFGNPQGVSSLSDRVTMSAVEPSIRAQHEVLDWQSKEQKHAAIAQAVSNSFFARAKGGESVDRQSKATATTREQVADHALAQFKMEPLRTSSAWALKAEDRDPSIADRSPDSKTLKPMLESDGDDEEMMAYSEKGTPATWERPQRGNQISVKA